MSSEQPQVAWNRCEGEVGQVVGRLKRRRLLRTLGRDISVVATVMLMLFSGYAFSTGMQPQELDYGGVMCGDVDHFSVGYIKGKLNSDLQARIDQHLKHCWHCNQRIAKAKAGERQTPLDPASSQGEVYAYPTGGGVAALMPEESDREHERETPTVQ